MDRFVLLFMVLGSSVEFVVERLYGHSSGYGL